MDSTHNLARYAALCTLVVAVAGACGDNAHTSRTLTITSPGADAILCVSDDQSSTTEGVQITVEVRADGFLRGDQIALGVEGTTVSLTQTVPADTETLLLFSGVTLPEGASTVRAHALGLTAQDAVVELSIDTSSPSLGFSTPSAEEPPVRLGPTDDVDPETLSVIDYVVDVQTNVPEGGTANLLVTPPGGAAVSLGAATVTEGHVRWQVPFGQRGLWTLRVETESMCGNPGAIEAQVFVDVPEAATDCAITITPGPITVGSLPAVLNVGIDPDPLADGFQASIRVDADLPGSTVTLFLDDATVDTGTAGADGSVTFDVDLDDALDLEVRARCTFEASIIDSLPNHVLVDTMAPACAIASPADGFVLTPAADLDPSDADTDFDVTVTLGGGDADGTSATVTIDGTASVTTISGGASTVRANVAAPDDDVPIRLDGTDQAGNLCSAEISGRHDTAGCAIEITTASPLIGDADAGTSGFQATITVTVGADCAGRNVDLASCDVGGLRTVTATGTTASFPVTLCSGTCETTRICTASVVEPGSNIATSDAQTFVIEDGPDVSMSITNPVAACGGTITVAADASPGTPGTQVVVRQFSSAVTREFRLTSPGGAPSVVAADSSGIATLTLVPGTSSIVACATDTFGLTRCTPGCGLTLVELAITEPLGGETLGLDDGPASAGGITIPVCGQVSTSSATVSVTIDGGAATSAPVDADGHWCAASVPIPSGTHTITATATVDGAPVTTSISVTVDVTAPGGVAGLTAIGTARDTITVSFGDPEPVQSCLVKSSTAAIPDLATFDALPTARVVAGSSSVHSEAFGDLRMGTPLYWAIRCFDGAGNGGPVSSVGPVSVTFEQGGTRALGPLTNPDMAFGTAATGADLNSDGFVDLIVGAPLADTDNDTTSEGRVAVYLGSAAGVAATPTYTIDMEVSGWARLGNGLARVDWNGDGVDDLAIGAPYADGFQGRVYVFYGARPRWSAAPGVILASTADVVIDLDVAEPTFSPALAFLGFSVETLDFDGDGRDDLLLGTNGYAGFRGGAMVLFGGSTAATIAVPGGLAAADAHAIFFSFATTLGTGEVGLYSATLGRLGGVGDTRDDFALGGAVDNTLGEDLVHVFDGRARPVARFTLVEHTTADEVLVGQDEVDGASGFGSRLGSIQDLDGDGRREILVAAPYHGNSGTGLGEGRVYVVPSTTTSTRKEMWSHAVATIGGPVSFGSLLGAGLANPASARNLGDVDGDGIEDLVFGGRALGATVAGTYVVFGRTGLAGNITSADASIVGPPAMAFTTDLVWVGDLDGDGREDLCWSDDQTSFTIADQAGVFQALY